VIEVLVGGARLWLLAQRAAYLPEHQTLLVADAHVGKAQSFRRLGVPVPGGTTAETLDRLSAAVAATGARRVVFLGDLLHSAVDGTPRHGLRSRSGDKPTIACS
jgi:metallophosphoesterase superfamily enzyme